MRLKNILVTAPRQLHSDSAMDLLQVITDQLESQDVQFTKAVRPDGNAVLKYEDRALDEGTPLTIFYWVVANPLPPLHAR